MFRCIGRKLKICAFIFMIIYVIQSLCLHFYSVWSLENMNGIFFDMIFALMMSILIYGLGLIVQLFEERKDLFNHSN